jgi:hypothetical protein
MGLRTDDRAVSNVIGAVFIFGILIILVAIYQAQVVPADNRAAEFDHSNTVQNDMVELRNAILTAKNAGRTTFAEVQLGTTYDSRIFAVNPPPPAGSLRTGEARPIAVDADSSPNLCPSGGTIQSRTLRFSPGYNVYDNAPDIVYENTVLYLDFGDRQITLTDEQLVSNDGDSVDIVPLNTSLSEQSVNTVSVEPIPGNVRENELTDANITLPTDLSQSQWRDLLAEDLPRENVTVSNGNLTIETGGEISVACSPLGLNEVPAGGERSEGGVDINPAGPNDIELRGVSFDNPAVNVTFNNTNKKSTNISKARLSFVAPGNNQKFPEVLNMSGESTTTADPNVQLVLYEPQETLDPSITLPGKNTTYIDFEPPENQDDFQSGSFFVVQFTFENGEQGTYFITVPK